MSSTKIDVYIGDTKIQDQESPVDGEFVEILGETYYRIRHFDQMTPFFMSLVSSSDHWLFLASTGGLAAGRVDADSALLPYETDDKVTANSEKLSSGSVPGWTLPE